MYPGNTTFKVDICLCLKMLQFQSKSMIPQPKFNKFSYLSSIDFYISAFLERRGKHLQPENKAFLYQKLPFNKSCRI